MSVDPKVQAAHDDLMKLTPPDRLRVAASLLDQGRGETAAAIIRRVSDELDAAIMLAKRRPRV